MGGAKGKKDKPSHAEAVRRIVEEAVAPRRARSMRPKVDYNSSRNSSYRPPSRIAKSPFRNLINGYKAFVA
jgi:hypothetical protein